MYILIRILVFITALLLITNYLASLISTMNFGIRTFCGACAMMNTHLFSCSSNTVNLTNTTTILIDIYLFIIGYRIMCLSYTTIVVHSICIIQLHLFYNCMRTIYLLAPEAQYTISGQKKVQNRHPKMS